MLLIDKLSGKPIYEQIIDGVEKNILLGIYPPGSAVPSQREMSVMLGINPNTIQKSYGELIRRGVIIPAMGSGSFVAPDAIEKIRSAATGRLAELSDMVADLALAHVTREEVIAAVNAVYDRPAPHDATIPEKGDKPS